MSDKTQHTATGLRERMLRRYNDGLHHKHNKCHLSYRKHFRSHPSTPHELNFEEPELNGATGTIREFKLRKMRKRLDKGRIH